MTIDSRTNSAIIWAADDPSLHEFEVKPRGSPKDTPGIKHTVYSYFRETYNIELQFPKMPIVNLGRDGWFPIEYLFQAKGKARGANSPAHVQGVLGYYDENSGTGCVDNIAKLSQLACENTTRHGMRFGDMLKQFNLRRGTDPVALTAKVLPEPQLSFSNENASLRNGSWDLRNKEFKR